LLRAKKQNYRKKKQPNRLWHFISLIRMHQEAATNSSNAEGCNNGAPYPSFSIYFVFSISLHHLAFPFASSSQSWTLIASPRGYPIQAARSAASTPNGDVLELKLEVADAAAEEALSRAVLPSHRADRYRRRGLLPRKQATASESPAVEAAAELTNTKHQEATFSQRNNNNNRHENPTCCAQLGKTWRGKPASSRWTYRRPF